MPLVQYGDEYDSIGKAGTLDIAPRDLPETTATDPSLLSTLGAAFRRENVVGSALSNQTAGLNRLEKEDGFNPLDEIKGTKYESRAMQAADIFNRPYFEAWKKQIDQEDEDRKTLDAAGWLGTGAGAVAAVLDLPTLIPGGALAREVSGGISVARSALSVALAGGIGAAASEAGLQSTQQTRTSAESAIGIGSGIVFGGLLGGGVGALLSRAEQKLASKAIDSLRKAGRDGTSLTPIADELEALRPKGNSTAGAAQVAGATMEDLSVAGRLAGGLAEKTAGLNPLLRALNSPSLKHREIMSGLVENSVYLRMNVEGRGSAAVETLQKQWDRGAMSAAMEEHRKIFTEARKQGLQMDQAQFNQAISRAMRNGDKADDPMVERAAQSWRSRVFDPLKKEAIEQGLLPADVDVSTADSYLTRLWNPRIIEAREADFRRIATDHVKQSVDAAVEKLTATRDRRLARINEEVADLEMPAEQRTALLNTLSSEISNLNVANERFAPTDEALRGLRTQLATARDGGARQQVRDLSTRIKQITDDAGQDYADYRTKRNALQSRLARVRNNIVGRRDRVEAARQALADGEAANIDRIKAVSKQLEKLRQRIANEDPSVYEAELAEVRTKLADVLERSTKAQDRLAQSKVKAAEAAQALARTPEEVAAGKDAASRTMAADVERSKARAGELRTQFFKASDELDERSAVHAKYMERQRTALAKAVERNDAGMAQSIEEKMLRRDEEFSAFDKSRSDELTAMLDEADALEGIDKEALVRDLLARNESRADALTTKMQTAQERFDAAEVRRLERAARLADQIGELEEFDAEGAVRALQELAEQRAAAAASIIQRETERMVGLANRMAQNGPEVAEARIKQLKERAATVERDYSDRVDIGLDAQNGYESYIKEVVDGVYNTLTGRSVTDIPRDIVPTARGPLKERTFNIPDRLVEDFLENDIELISRRYTRTMAADVEMTRRFGSPTMIDQITEVQEEYASLREALNNSDMAPDRKAKALKDMNKREKSDINDLKASRDLLRGTYGSADNSSNFARIARGAQTFNYMRSMGGVLVASLTDAVRPAMVHGLGAYMRDGIKPLVSNLKGLRMSAADAKLAGTISDRILQSRLATMAELTDPYSASSPFERFLDNAANKFTTLTGLNHWNDFQRTLSSVMTQNRVLRNVEKEFASLSNRERAYMGYLGVDEDMSRRIASEFAQHGEDIDGVKVANTEDWTDEAARRAYYAAINKDVDSTIVVKGVADIPLFAHSAVGRAAIQFKSFALASNQRVLMRGLQESPVRAIGGVMGMSVIGMFTYWLKQMEAGRDVSNNPGTWVAEGLDRSGIFAIAFEANNAIEKAGGWGAYSLLSKAGQAADPTADLAAPASRFATRSVVEGFLGPTFGLANDVVGVGSVGLRATRGDADLTPGDIATARRLMPYVSLPYFRWLFDGGLGLQHTGFKGIVPELKEQVN